MFHIGLFYWSLVSNCALLLS